MTRSGRFLLRRMTHWVTASFAPLLRTEHSECLSSLKKYRNKFKKAGNSLFLIQNSQFIIHYYIWLNPFCRIVETEQHYRVILSKAAGRVEGSPTDSDCYPPLLRATGTVPPSPWHRTWYIFCGRPYIILHSALFHVNSEIRIHMKQIPLHLRLLWWTAAVFVPQSS